VKLYKRMLVPLDGSELAEIAFNYAKNLAYSLKVTEVFLLHVYSPDERGLVPKHRAYIERAADTIMRHSEKVKSGAIAVKAQGELAMGNPAEEILRYADRNDIDLILMATHGRSGVSRWAMGSVAYKVLRAAKVPVWLIRDGIAEEIIEDKLPIRTILVPLDGSKLAESVLPHVETLAKQWADGQTEVVLLRVCQPPDVSSDYPSDMPLSWEEHVELEMAKCKLEAGPYLAEIGKRLREAGLEVRYEVPLGKTAAAIIDYTLSNRVSLIAMITHGRSGISRWAYGSVAEEVMLGAFTPVLLVKSPPMMPIPADILR
jgi:nucleotide-binding universal stress UspA family protein